jgi:hypothetical protein
MPIECQTFLYFFHPDGINTASFRLGPAGKPPHKYRCLKGPAAACHRQLITRYGHTTIEKVLV